MVMPISQETPTIADSESALLSSPERLLRNASGRMES
jgi:hypothetical protein